MSTQRGFTLIELVVVIVILGLLAATALPKFINVTSDARQASVQGVAGGLRAAAALAQAQYVVNGTRTATSVTMSGAAVATLDEATYNGRGGRPTCAGIREAMANPDGFTVTPAACTGIGDTVTYTPQGGSGTCQVTYDPDAIGEPVQVTTTAC